MAVSAFYENTTGANTCLIHLVFDISLPNFQYVLHIAWSWTIGVLKSVSEKMLLK